MRMPRVVLWPYTALLVAIGVGALIWGFSLAADADAYRKAPYCGNVVTPSCYEVFSGVITSVQVNQTRSGEQDDVVIRSATAGNVTATLRPSATAAPHIRTGANVTVERYRGQVTVVGVDGFGVASTANPAANQSDLFRIGWLVTGIGMVSTAFVVYSARRRNRRIAAAYGDRVAGSAMAQQTILPSGTLGWSLRPQLTPGALGRYAIVIVALLFLTIRPLLDPARTTWALLFDSMIVVLVCIVIGLFYRNSRVFADREYVGKVNLLGRTKRLPLQDLKRADRFSVATRYGANKHLVFVGADGRKAFEVAGTAWDFDRLDTLCREAGIQLSGSYDDMVGAFRLNQRVPGITKWSQQLLILGGVTVVIVALVVLVTGPTQR
jgi:hypothetical protein